MTQVKSNLLEQTLDKTQPFSSSLLRSISLFNLLGYGLLVFGVVLVGHDETIMSHELLIINLVN